jgi:16S rRNA (guanine966-N2)-methyltransferase
VAVVEESAEAELSAPAGFEEIDRRRYGDTQVVFLRAE